MLSKRVSLENTRNLYCSSLTLT